jgi:HEPN domain-containing protein
MVDISEQISYWRNSAREDFEVAKQLVDSGKNRHGLFFAHLALEKTLKAHVCKTTQELAPRVHNLVRLSEISGIRMPESYVILLSEMNAFNLEGRYPMPFITAVSQEEAENYIAGTQEVLEWLNSQL